MGATVGARLSGAGVTGISAGIVDSGAAALGSGAGAVAGSGVGAVARARLARRTGAGAGSAVASGSGAASGSVTCGGGTAWTTGEGGANTGEGDDAGTGTGAGALASGTTGGGVTAGGATGCASCATAEAGSAAAARSRPIARAGIVEFRFMAAKQRLQDSTGRNGCDETAPSIAEPVAPKRISGANPTPTPPLTLPVRAPISPTSPQFSGHGSQWRGAAERMEDWWLPGRLKLRFSP